MEKNFEKTFKEISKLKKQLRRECIDFLKKALADAENNEIIFDRDDSDIPTVVYDGGRYPEYAANPYSIVERVYMVDGKIFVDTEDTDEYPVKNVDSCDLYEICIAVQNF